MHYYSADYLFDGEKFLPSNAILCVQGDGTIDGIIFDKGELTVIHKEGLICPGFVNAHCHVELSHLKHKINQGIGLVNFILEVNRLRYAESAESKAFAIQTAEEEMIENGIVAVGDIANTMDSFMQKEKKNLHYHTFIECFGLLDEHAQKKVDEAKRKQKEFSKLHSSSVVLHAPYSCSETLIQLVDDLSTNQITSIHNQESDEENKLFQFGDGDFLRLFEQLDYKNKLPLTTISKRSIQSYFTKFKHQQHIILVHNTYTNKEDLHYLQTLSKDIYWCLCVHANLYIENRLPDIALLHQSGVPIILGTDSLASNTNLSILEEIKTIHQFYPSIPITDILHWATLQGAQALGITDKFGSFLKGKKPGVLHIGNFNLLHGIDKTAMVRRLW